MTRYRTPHRVRRKKAALKKGRRRLPGKRISLLVLGTLLLGAAGYALVFADALQLQRVEVRGANRIDPEQIRLLAAERVRRDVGPWESESMLVLDTALASRELQQVYPPIASVTLDRTLFERSLTVTVQEREEAAFWCRGADECFLVDREGIAFWQEEGNDLPELVLPGQEGGLAVQVIDPALLERVLALRSPFVRSASSGQAGSPELREIRSIRFVVVGPERVNAVTSEGWEIYADPSGDLDWQLTKLRAVAEEKLSSAERKTLQYIDLRFGDQAYYQ